MRGSGRGGRQGHMQIERRTFLKHTAAGAMLSCFPASLTAIERAAAGRARAPRSWAHRREALHHRLRRHRRQGRDRGAGGASASRTPSIVA